MSEFEKTSSDNAPGPGAIISYAREQLGISIEDLATELKLSQHKLLLIESNQFELVGTDTFVRGYLRNASRVLQLDIVMLLAEYDAYQGINSDAQEVHAEPVPPKSRSAKNNLLWLLPIVLAVILSWWFFAADSSQVESTNTSDANVHEVDNSAAMAATLTTSSSASKTTTETNEASAQGSSQGSSQSLDQITSSQTDEQSNSQNVLTDSASNENANSDSPNSAQSGASDQLNASAVDAVDNSNISSSGIDDTSVGALSGQPIKAKPPIAKTIGAAQTSDVSSVLAEGEKQLLFSFTDTCWLQVRDATGKRLYSNTKASGQQLRLKGVAPFRVNLGNARAVSLTVNGQAFPIQAREGRKTLALTIL